MDDKTKAIRLVLAMDEMTQAFIDCESLEPPDESVLLAPKTREQLLRAIGLPVTATVIARRCRNCGNALNEWGTHSDRLVQCM